MLSFIKIRQVGVELFHAEGQKDRQTDRHDETTSRFSHILRTRLKTTPGIAIIIALCWFHYCHVTCRHIKCCRFALCAKMRTQNIICCPTSLGKSE